MNAYLVDVINDKGVKDLRDTREQVKRLVVFLPSVFVHLMKLPRFLKVMQ